MGLKEEFIKKAIKQHGYKFDYSKVEYKDALTKVVIICLKHGEFEQTPSCHINSKSGCLICKTEKNYLDFIEKANKLHKNKFNYSKFIYKSQKEKSIIICPEHGGFEDSPRNHLNNKYGCLKCMEENLANEFFKKANEKHNNKFDYSKFKYINAKTKSVIICPIHGDYLQDPDHHLRSINACQRCENEAKKKRNVFSLSENIEKASEAKKIKEEDFLARAIKKYGDNFLYDLTNYNGITGNDIKIKCHKHGWFLKQPHNFLICSYGCTSCSEEKRIESKTKTYDSFIKEANKKHNNKYTYNKNTFENRNSVVEINCAKHGKFEKRAIKHLYGQGCNKCRIENLILEGKLPGGYNKKLFKNNRKLAKKQGYLYYIYIEDLDLFKIGITINLDKRVNALKSKFNVNNIKIIYVKSSDLEKVYDIEQKILKTFKNYRAKNDKSTELFIKDISKNVIFEDIVNKNIS